MQIRKQELELDMEQQTGLKLGKEYTKAVYCLKLGKEYTKAVYCHPAYLTHMQSE